MEFDIYSASADRETCILKFHATWCLPCHALTTTLRSPELADFNQRIYAVDVDLEPEVAARYNIMSVPTLIFLREGVPTNRVTGNITTTQIKNFITKGLRLNAE